MDVVSSVYRYMIEFYFVIKFYGYYFYLVKENIDKLSSDIS